MNQNLFRRLILTSFFTICIFIVIIQCFKSIFNSFLIIIEYFCYFFSDIAFVSALPNEVFSNEIGLNESSLSTEGIEAFLLQGNNEEDLSKYLPCIQCNSKMNGNSCSKIENPLFLSNCRKAIGQCYTAIMDGHVYRGCVGDELFPDRKSAANPFVPIKLCNDNRMCNQDTIVDTCIGCSGKQCKSPTLDMERPCSLDPTHTKGCYLKKLKGKSYERGCMQDLAEKEQEKCQKPGSIECQSCFYRNCNQKVSVDQRCYYCNGTKETSCSEAKSQTVSITCIDYSSSCLVGIDEAGYAHRQCSSSPEQDTLRFPKGFELCYGNLCNSQIFPKDFTKCFRCANGRSCDHPSADLLPELCRIYGDSCFTYGIEGDYSIFQIS